MKDKSHIEAAILEGLAEGSSLAELCRKHKISRSTYYSWKRASPDLAGREEDIRSDRADALLDDCLEIADDSANDWMERKRGDGSQIADLEHIRRSALRINTRMKLAARLDPKRYGVLAPRPEEDDASNPPRINAIIEARRMAIARGDD